MVRDELLMDRDINSQCKCSHLYGSHDITGMIFISRPKLSCGFCDCNGFEEDDFDSADNVQTASESD